MPGKVAVMIMATDKQPSLRNIEGIKETYIACYNRLSQEKTKRSWLHEFDFFVYTSDPTIQVDYICVDDTNVSNLHYVKVREEESVYRTFEKTLLMYKYMISEHNNEYCCYVRTNISMMLNMYMLDKYIDRFKPDTVYCNAVNSHTNAQSEFANDIYPRGDLMIFDDNILRGFVATGDKYVHCDMDMHHRNGVDHVDDCLSGLCLIDMFGKEYYKHIKPLRYYYIPRGISKEMLPDWRIGYRVKTIPPDVEFSGYSWDDNDWRRYDVEKMKVLQQYFDENANELLSTRNVQLGDVLANIHGGSDTRPTLFIQTVNCSLAVIQDYLSKKR